VIYNYDLKGSSNLELISHLYHDLDFILTFIEEKSSELQERKGSIHCLNETYDEKKRNQYIYIYIYI